MLQILQAETVEEFEKQPTTNSRHQEHNELMEWNYNVFTHICRSWISRISSAKPKLARYNSICFTTYQIWGDGKRYGKL